VIVTETLATVANLDRGVKAFAADWDGLILATQPIEVTLIQRPKPIATKIISAADG